MDPNTTKIILAVIAAVVGAGVAITLTVKFIRRTNNTTRVTANRVKQKNINTFGDVVGGNKTTK